MRSLLLNCCLLLTFSGQVAVANPPATSTALRVAPSTSTDYIYKDEAFELIMGSHESIRDAAPFLSFYAEGRNKDVLPQIKKKFDFINNPFQVEALRLMVIADAATESNINLAIGAENQADVDALRDDLNRLDFCSQVLRWKPWLAD